MSHHIAQNDKQRGGCDVAQMAFGISRCSTHIIRMHPAAAGFAQERADRRRLWPCHGCTFAIVHRKRAGIVYEAGTDRSADHPLRRAASGCRGGVGRICRFRDRRAGRRIRLIERISGRGRRAAGGAHRWNSGPAAPGLPGVRGLQKRRD